MSQMEEQKSKHRGSVRRTQSVRLARRGLSPLPAQAVVSGEARGGCPDGDIVAGPSCRRNAQLKRPGALPRSSVPMHSDRRPRRDIKGATCP
jgi:hypothetical protein